MSNPGKSTRGEVLATPRAAAISGVAFAVLAFIGLGLARYAVPADMKEPGNWLLEPERREAVQAAIDLVPFAGIAFLWFMGVLRSRLGELEDQFFATVFIGSGLLFVAAMFCSAAVSAALIQAVAVGNVDGQTYYFGRWVSDVLLNLFAMKMAGVFMFSTCTIGLQAAILPRWVGYIGYACALMLVLIIANWRWITLVFPLWMLLLSTTILLAEFRPRPAAASDEARRDLRTNAG